MTTKFQSINSKFKQLTKRRELMSQGGTIVVRRANTFIPNDYAELVLAANPNGWGAAIVTLDEEKNRTLQLNSADEGMTLEFLQETMKAFPEYPITFHFINSEAALNAKDIPPYLLLTKKDGNDEVPLIVGFADGNFPGFKKADSSHPAEYHLMQDYLIPKFESLAEMADGNLDRITDLMQKPFFKKELLLNAVSRGTITIVAANGVEVTFNQSDLSAEYPWGWVSNNHGYALAKKEEPKETKVEKPKGAFSRSTVREKHVPVQDPAIAEATKPPVAAAATIKNYTTRVVKMPTHLTRAERKDYLKRHIGYAPKNLADKGGPFHVAVDPEGKLMTFSDIKKLGTEAIIVGEMLAKVNPARDKNTEPDHIPEIEQSSTEKVTSTEKAVTAEVLPLMSPATRDHVKKLIAGNAAQIMDPAKIKALQSKFADFATQVGAKSIHDFKYSYEMLLQLGREKPDGLAVLCWNALNIIHSKDEKATVVEEKQEEEAPKKRSMFSRAG